MTSLRRLATILPMLLFCAAAHATPDITAYAEEYAPYSFADKGQVRGIAADLLKSACDRAELRCEIRILPWARAYWLAQNEANTIAFTMVRLPARESEFQWVGPILPDDAWIFGQVDAPRARQFADLARRRVAVTIGGAAEATLRREGVPESAFDRAPNFQAGVRKFIAHRVDYIGGTELALLWTLKQAGASTDVNRLLRVSNGGDYYYALNRRTKPDIAARLNRAIKDLIASGERDRVVRSYVKLPD